jgi:hypothetical protein
MTVEPKAGVFGHRVEEYTVGMRRIFLPVLMTVALLGNSSIWNRLLNALIFHARRGSDTGSTNAASPRSGSSSSGAPTLNRRTQQREE